MTEITARANAQRDHMFKSSSCSPHASHRRNMATTPKKRIHWQMDLSPSLDSSDCLETGESFVTSTSTLDYVNTQLIAHGFASSPGLCLDGASNADSAGVTKCLLGLLGQRVVRHQFMQ